MCFRNQKFSNCKKRIHCVFCVLQGSANSQPIGHIWPVFVNKVLLLYSYTHWFTYCPWLLSATVAELSSHHSSCMPTKPKIFTLWLFAGKVCWLVLYTALKEVTCDVCACVCARTRVCAYIYWKTEFPLDLCPGKVGSPQEAGEHRCRGILILVCECMDVCVCRCVYVVAGSGGL